MNRIIFIIVLILSVTTVKSQSLVIDSISVSRVITHLVDNNFGENESNGPLIYFYATIKNDLDSTVILSPSESTLEIKYQYNDRYYSVEIEPITAMPFIEKENIILRTNEYINFEFSSWIFMGTNILNLKRRKIYDYTTAIIQVLPTIQVVYKQNIYRLTSKGICSVKLREFDFTY